MAPERQQMILVQKQQPKSKKDNYKACPDRRRHIVAVTSELYELPHFNVFLEDDYGEMQDHTYTHFNGMKLKDLNLKPFFLPGKKLHAVETTTGRVFNLQQRRFPNCRSNTLIMSLVGKQVPDSDFVHIKAPHSLTAYSSSTSTLASTLTSTLTSTSTSTV